MRTLVIIGAGFSGVVTAINFLLEASPGVRVVLINRSGAMGRGLAYGTSSPHHLLNIPVGNMTALEGEPDSFLLFCQRKLARAAASSFVSRKLYGDYLASLLDEAEQKCREGVSLERMVADVCKLTAHGSGMTVELASGETLQADQVVLAFGHFAPLAPFGGAPVVAAGRYQADPWAAGRLAAADADKPILLVGAGLTALDVALSLLQQGHQGTIHMLSRRGLLPLAHREQRSAKDIPVGFCERLLNMRPTVRNYLREIREQIAQGDMEGLNWRDVLAALRPFTSELWARLPEIEQRRFLRHVQPYWDVHRHRVAPEAYLRFQEALANGRIRLMAGRIQTVESDGEGVRVSILLRGGNQCEHVGVVQIINCTGPNADLRRVDTPLIVHLREKGLIKVDPHGLGLCVDKRLAVRSSAGDASPVLSYVGPMLKADLWEATAVPELRVHAKSLACRLVEFFRNQPELN